VNTNESALKFTAVIIEPSTVSTVSTVPSTTNGLLEKLNGPYVQEMHGKSYEPDITCPAG
jgi:hypothetical protein